MDPGLGSYGCDFYVVCGSCAEFDELQKQRATGIACPILACFFLCQSVFGFAGLRKSLLSLYCALAYHQAPLMVAAWSPRGLAVTLSLILRTPRVLWQKEDGCKLST